VGVELSHADVQTDGRTDGEKKIKKFLCSGQPLQAIKNYRFPFYPVNSPTRKINPITG